MKKRILSFVLALLMVVSIFPAPAYATDSTDVTVTPTEKSTETACPTCDIVGCTSEHLTWCAECKEDDCGVDHTPAQPCGTCGSTECDGIHENWCADCKVDNCGVTHVFCEICQVNDCGQNHCPTCGTVGCTSEHLTWCAECKKDDCGVDHTAPQPCGTCGSTECGGIHENWCSDCKVDNCGKTHVFCEICQVNDCGQNHCPTCGTIDCAKEHKTCDKCGAIDCTTDHTNWCDTCKKDNCDVTHVYCETCQKNDCGQNHCPTCGAVDCTADHTNWCDTCKKDNCGVDHGTAANTTVCDVCGNEVCTCETATEPEQDNCPYCEETTAEDGTVTHAEDCTAAYVYDGTADVNKYLQFINADSTIYVTDTDNLNKTPDLYFYGSDFEAGTILHIADWYWDSATTALWYQVDFYAGAILDEWAADWPADAWVLYDYTDTTWDYAPGLAFVDTCGICGKPDCSTTHVYCETCQKYDCGENHEEAEQEKNRDISDISESGKSVSVSGSIPSDVSLVVTDVATAELGSEFTITGTVVAALDITPQYADGTEWQPTENYPVIVELDAGDMGLTDGDIVKLHHKHGSTVETYDEFVVINGKITFLTDSFSIYLVEEEFDTQTDAGAKEIELDANGNATYSMTVGDESQVFYTTGADVPTDFTKQSGYTYYKYYVWSVTDANGAIDYRIRNYNGQMAGNEADNQYDARVAPWINVTPKRAGTVTLTVKSYYQGWNGSSTTNAVQLSTETLTLVVINPADTFYVQNQVPETGCLIPMGLEAYTGVTYTWTRSDNVAIRLEALNDDGSVNVAKDRGGIINDSSKDLGSSDPIVYTVTATLPDGTTRTATYEITYGNEILNPSFEVPDDAKANWDPPWGVAYGYITNGVPGVHWKTTSPGDGYNLGRDIEFGSAASVHGASPAHGDQYVELNAENYGALYQDILTSPGATLKWNFSHAARKDANKNQMYIVMAATEHAEKIVDLATIQALIEAAGGTDDASDPAHIPSSGTGYEFEHNGGTYRIWYNDANSGVGIWETVSGSYMVPDGQYLTRLFFVSNPLYLNQDNTMGNLIDAVSAGEFMSYTIEYYETNELVTDKTESGTDVSAYTTVDLANLQSFLTKYEYPFKILVNGKEYSGTVEDLKNKGLYITDYGTKEGASAGDAYNNYDIVVQIYFQVPNVRVTKNVVIQDWDTLSATKKQQILNAGLDAEFQMQNDNDSDDKYTASVSINQQGTDGSLSASTSFPIDQAVYGKAYTVTETSATEIEGYELITTVTDNTFTLDETDGPHVVNVTVTNTYYPRGGLKVTKYVEKQSEADADPDSDMEFTFTVTLPTDPAKLPEFAYTIYNGGEITDTTDDTQVSTGKLAVTNNALTFKLKHNQYIVIEDLPIGAVTITEEPVAGFETSFDKDAYAITAGAVESAVCTNTLTRTTGNLKITKKVVNTGNGTVPTPAAGYAITVTLNPYALDTVDVLYTKADGTEETKNEAVNDGSFTVYLFDGWTASIANIPAAGYRVTEQAYDDFAVTWKTKNEANEWVEGGDTGLIRGGQTTEVECTNTYPVNAGDLRITKTVRKEHDRDTVPDEEYTIQVVFTKLTGEAFGSDQKFAYNVFNKGSDPTAKPVSEGHIASGETLKLKDGQYAIISNIPYCNFDVIETEDVSRDQYDVAYAFNKGKEIISGQEVTAEVINTYKRTMGNLKITKNVTGATNNDGQTFLFRITGPDNFSMSVMLAAGQSKTIYDLPVGVYTVTEDTSWSWRYVLKEINGVTVNGTNSATADLNTYESVELTFTNEYDKNQWLSDTDAKSNTFTATSTPNS